MKYEKIPYLLLILMMCLGLVACGNETGDVQGLAGEGVGAVAESIEKEVGEALEILYRDECTVE